MLTNGLGFSPDGSCLYHCDSRADIICVYDVHHDGSASPWRVFTRVEGGTPDGMAVAEDSSAWVALAHGSCVAVFAPDGSERTCLPVPLPMMTSVCFGGDDLHDYVVTGSRGGLSDHCGIVYRAEGVGRAGVQVRHDMLLLLEIKTTYKAIRHYACAGQNRDISSPPCREHSAPGYPGSGLATQPCRSAAGPAPG